MKIETKIKQDKVTSEVEGLPKEELKKLAGYGLMVIWVIALVLGLGANSWFLFFVALVLTFSYLFKINGIEGSAHNYDGHKSTTMNSSSIMNSHTTKPIGHNWSSATGSNLINSPTFSSFNGNIYNR